MKLRLFLFAFFFGCPLLAKINLKKLVYKELEAVLNLYSKNDYPKPKLFPQIY